MIQLRRSESSRPAHGAAALTFLLLISMAFQAVFGVAVAGAAPLDAATVAGALTIFDDAPRNGFTVAPWGYGARTPCDSSSYATGSCSYAIALQPGGGLAFVAPAGGVEVRTYAAFQFAIQLGGQPLGSFAVALTDRGNALLRQVALDPGMVVGQPRNGWVQVAVPIAQLGAPATPVGALQLRNVSAASLPIVRVDDVQLAPPGATPPPIPAPPGEALAVSAALRLDGAVVGVGGTLTGTVTYRNTSSAPLAIRSLVIAARSADGTHGDFAPGKGAATIPAGGTISLTATRTIAAADTGGSWYAFSSWQDSAGVWHPAPTSLDVPFTVTRPGANAPIYWGAYVKGVPWDLSILDTFESRAGKRASIVHWGQPWWYNGRYDPFQTALYERIRSRGSIPMIDWGSWDFCCGSAQPNFQLADITAGQHDAFIRQWATDAKAWGHPLFLRMNWEMNGSWFPWSEAVNGNQPGDYVRAWRHVHDLFAQVGATNVTWVWSANEVAGQATPLATLYPGDAYVDWVAVDSYNWGTDHGYRWRSFAQAFDATYAALGQLAPTKPIMIAETASSEDGGSKAAWIRDTFQTQLPTNYPKIKAVLWFNWNDDDPTLDWPIESSQASIDAFRQSVGTSSYYAANAFGAISASPIPPIGASAQTVGPPPLARTGPDVGPLDPPGPVAVRATITPIWLRRGRLLVRGKLPSPRA